MDTESKKTLLSPSGFRILTWTFFGYFILRLVYIAITVSHEVPPDEKHHVTVVEGVSQYALLPGEYQEGDKAAVIMVSYQPYLYYLLAGKLIHLNFFPMSDLTFLRLLSAVMGSLTVLFGWKLIRLLTEDWLVQLLFLVLMTNTLMFTFISASVSYDAATNLLSAASIYYMVRYFKEGASTALILLILCMALGSLTKTTLLPLNFALVVCLLIHDRKAILKPVTYIKKNLRPQGFGRWCLLGAMVVALGLNALLYGGNLIRFQQLIPTPSKILPVDVLLGHSTLGRNIVVAEFRRGDLTFDEAMKKATLIPHTAVAQDTQTLIWRIQRKRDAGETFEPVSRATYAYYWGKLMIRSIYGVLGHDVIFRSENALRLYWALFFGSVFLLILRQLQGRGSPIELYLAGLVVFYAFILMQVVNYKNYIATEELMLAVQGRYLFPVIVPTYAIMATYLLKGWKEGPKIAVVLILTVLFVHGDFLFFLQSSGW